MWHRLTPFLIKQPWLYRCKLPGHIYFLGLFTPFYSDPHGSGCTRLVRITAEVCNRNSLTCINRSVQQFDSIGFCAQSVHSAPSDIVDFWPLETLANRASNQISSNFLYLVKHFILLEHYPQIKRILLQKFGDTNDRKRQHYRALQALDTTGGWDDLKH